MNAEQLLQHFERISEAPDAIKRLRRFILDLAVRGKLVEQDPSEEPASELVKRITAEKVMLVKAGEIKKQKPLGALPESPFPIPSNWCWSQLAEIGVLSPRNEAPDTLEVSFVPMPLIAADYGVANQHEIRPWAEIKKGYTHFAEGDVGLAKITPCFENGKSSVFRNLTGGLGSGTTELYIVRPLFVNQDYILLFLKSPHFIETGIPKMTGTAGQKRVPTNYFSNSPFPLPPLAEQHRIVAKADELMSLCDQLEAAKAEREKCRDSLVAASLQRLNQPAEEEETFREYARFTFNNLPQITTRAAHIKQLRQTILNLAVRGKLVEQRFIDGSAIDELKSITEQRGTSKKGRRSSQVTNEGEALNTIKKAVPSSWFCAYLGDIVDPLKTISYGVLVPGDNIPGGVPLVRAQDLCLSGHPQKPNKCIAPDVERAYARTRLEGGEILLCVVGSIGKIGIAPSEWAGANIARAVARIKPVPQVYRDYLLLFLQSQNAQSSFKDSTRTLAQPTLNIGLIEQTPIPLPPLAEQQRIVAKVAELMAICDQLESQITEKEQDSRRFLESVLADALAPGIECNHH